MLFSQSNLSLSLSLLDGRLYMQTKSQVLIHSLDEDFYFFESRPQMLHCLQVWTSTSKFIYFSPPYLHSRFSLISVCFSFMKVELLKRPLSGRIFQMNQLSTMWIHLGLLMRLLLCTTFNDLFMSTVIFSDESVVFSYILEAFNIPLL